jgi:hypothetical protein
LADRDICLVSGVAGGQVLFAFLLGINFTQRYAQLDASDRRVFFGEMYVPRHAASSRGHGAGRRFAVIWFVLP